MSMKILNFLLNRHEKLKELKSKKISDGNVPLHLARILQNFKDDEEARFYLFIFGCLTKKESLSPTTLMYYELCQNLGNISRFNRLCEKIDVDYRTGLRIAERLEKVGIVTINRDGLVVSITLSSVFSLNFEKYINIIRNKKPFELDEVDEEAIKW